MPSCSTPAAGGFQGLGDWLWDALRYTETPYAHLAERGGTDPALENAARRDVETFSCWPDRLRRSTSTP